MLIPQTPFFPASDLAKPAPNPCSHLPVLHSPPVLKALLSQGFLGSPGGPRPFPLGLSEGLCLKFKGNSTNNPVVVQPEAPPRPGRNLGTAHLSSSGMEQGTKPRPLFPAQPLSSLQGCCMRRIPSTSSKLCRVKLLQPCPAAGTECPHAPWHFLKMKNECLVVRVEGNHRQEAAPQRGGHCQALGVQLRGPHLPALGQGLAPGSTDSPGRAVVTPA